ncbi:hypothetical protein WJX84_005055 [Apatococcus fuscideae]|uniref:Aldehyde oxidase/xanthine dehydrogenase a/b hammerhead domain-containing protein n=1 Tax=Apatococcus fuscideae TaxID=2026836 RepID=A0AAW1S857_9CHLO
MQEKATLHCGEGREGGTERAPPVHLPVEKDRIRLQASGEARYTGDMMLDGAELYAYVVKSARALATITSVDPSAALQVPGVLKYISASDIPKGGINGSVHGSIQPEPLFATDRVIYQGQPIGLIVAESPSLAERACDLVRVEYGPDGELGDPIITLEDAIAKSSFFEGPALVGGSAFRKRSIGNATAALQAAPHTITDASYMLPSQQHMYMEPHVSVAEPDEDGTISVWSSTQSPDACQKAVADVLGLPYHNVRVRTRRVGGAFGGKVTRPCQIAAGAALAAWKLGRKVHLAITRDDDLRMNGGRNPTKVLYSVGFQPDGRITALDIRGWMQCGALLDLAFNDAGVLQAKADQAYAFPNMSVDIKLCRCNIAPKTIVRGPGFLNAALVAEHILEHVAQHLDLDPVVPVVRDPQSPLPTPLSQAQASEDLVSRALTKLRYIGSLLQPALAPQQLPQTGCIWRIAPADDVLRPGDVRTPLGTHIKAGSFTLWRVWDGVKKMSNFYQRRAEVQEFNSQHAWRKRGIALSPVRFDVAPAAMPAAVTIYADGSVLVSHGGIEMGQGLATKVKQVAAFELGKLLPAALQPLPMELVRIGDTDTAISPNGGPTWSSTGGGRDGNGQTHSQASASRPPMSYTLFAAACTEVEIDVLTGEHFIRQTDIFFDCGRSLNPMIDMGQVEGAFVFGLGMMTTEEVVVDPRTGRLLTDSTWTYKIPTAPCVPSQFNVSFLKDSPNEHGVMSSKACGEPSLMLAPATVARVRDAIGGPSIAAVLRNAAGLQPAELCSTDDWELI